MTERFVLRSQNVVLPHGLRAADLLIEAGIVQEILPYQTVQDAVKVDDVGDLWVLPGLVDTHVHLNEPGRTEWEGFETGTAAAHAGGVTTLIDMPLNSSPVTTTESSLRIKRDAAQGNLHVDVAFHAGLVPENADDVVSVLRAGAIAAKAFLCPSGMDEFGHVGEAELQKAMPKLAAAGALLMVHAEIATEMPPLKNPRRYADYLASRPRSFERHAIERMIEMMRRTGCRVHIVHLADADCLPMIEEVRSEGLPLTVETCPHYLTFASEEIDDGRTDFKCAPPIRDADNRERLWDGLRRGLIDAIVSDHSPCPPALKQIQSGRFDEAWGGISSLQLGLPVVHTEAIRRDFSLLDVVRWMSDAPAQLVRWNREIKPSNPAHLVVFDPHQSWIVDQAKLHHRHPITPYHGRKLTGAVVKTYVHGNAERAFQGKSI